MSSARSPLVARHNACAHASFYGIGGVIFHSTTGGQSTGKSLKDQRESRSSGARIRVGKNLRLTRPKYHACLGGKLFFWRRQISHKRDVLLIADCRAHEYQCVKLLNLNRAGMPAMVAATAIYSDLFQVRAVAEPTSQLSVSKG